MSKIGFEIKTPTQGVTKPKRSTRYRFEFILDTERDKKLIQKLESQANKAEYLRSLIQKDL